MGSPSSHWSEDAPSDGMRALVGSVLAGDAAALSGWYEREHPAVFRLCFGFLADRAEAEDAAQDAMLHLHDRLERWTPDHPWRAWRDAVVLNLCRDRLRREAARSRAHLRAVTDEGAEQGRGVLPDPSSEAERAEVRAVLQEALGALSPREREAFVLRDLEQNTTADVANVLGISTGSVRSLLTLARRRLRGVLGQRLPEAGGDRA